MRRFVICSIFAAVFGLSGAMGGTVAGVAELLPLLFIC